MGSCASLYKCQGEPQCVHIFTADHDTTISVVRPDPRTIHEACEDGEAKMVSMDYYGRVWVANLSLGSPS